MRDGMIWMPKILLDGGHIDIQRLYLRHLEPRKYRIINVIMVSGNHITIVALPLLIPTIFVSHLLMDFHGRIFMSSFPLTFSIK